MVPKKRNAASRSKHSRNPSQPAAASKSPDSASTVDSESSEKAKFYNTINNECFRALMVLKEKGEAEALKVLTELCSEHENSDSEMKAYMYRAQGTCFKNMAKVTNDESNAKQLHLKAIESARTAVSLSPNSIEFAHFYACLLYDAANESNDYEEVVKECKRALGIKEPVDHPTYSSQFVSDNGQKGGSTGDRVAVLKTKLKLLIEKVMAEDLTKEIEMKAAAARLLQQMSESVVNLAGNDVDSSGSNTNSMGMERRKKSGRKNGNPSDKRREQVQHYWNSLTVDLRISFLKIKVSDLKAHFISLKDESVIKVLNEALSYGKVNKVWKFWMCYFCYEIFFDAGSLVSHLDVHVREMSPKLLSVSRLKNEWADMILGFSWKPLELNASIGILEKYSKEKKPDLNLRCSGSIQDSSELEDVGVGTLLHEKWPLSDDTERATRLERIHVTLQTLMKNKCLAESHLNKSIKLALDNLQELVNASQLPNFKIYETPICICLLGVPGLEKILFFLDEISKSCELSTSSADNSKTTQNSNAGVQVDNNEEINILLSEDASLLFFDENSLPCKIPLSSCDENSGEAASAHILDSNELLSWVFTGLPIDEHLAWWTSVRQEKAREGIKILQSMVKDLHQMREKQSEHVSYIEELQNVEGLCLEEDKKRLNGAAYVHQSYETVLRKRREVLTENDNDDSTKFKLDAIAYVLKDLNLLVDFHIELEIKRRKEQVDIESCKIDARILQTRTRMEQLSHDFRYILIPLVKSFLRACVEDLAEKDAIEKSNAAMDALLAELATDSKKGVGAGSGNPKDKKKKKKDPKKKNPKFTISSESHDQSSDKIFAFPSIDDDALRLQEEENKRIMEIDVETLEKKLEYQRQLENEAKQKHLAEQQERISKTSMEKEEQIAISDDHLAHRDATEQCTDMKGCLENLAEKDATEKSDAGREAFLPELAVEFKKGVDAVSGNPKFVHERTKDMETSEKNGKNKNPKFTIGNESHNQSPDKILPPSAHDEKGPGSGIYDDALGLSEEDYDVSLRLQNEYDDGKRLQEKHDDEENRHRMELEAEERNHEETLEYQRQLESEATKQCTSMKKMSPSTLHSEAADTNQRIGVDVTAEAQSIFDTLSKMLHVRWDKSTIIVMDEIRISSPYLPESVIGGTPAANERVRKVLEFVNKLQLIKKKEAKVASLKLGVQKLENLIKKEEEEVASLKLESENLMFSLLSSNLEG